MNNSKSSFTTSQHFTTMAPWSEAFTTRPIIAQTRPGVASPLAGFQSCQISLYNFKLFGC